ncbi:50S ribosomal protein L29 [Ornatilinea apprima]|uniref:Large ribosomal subunit protein uL29 n=1 Tax=Ornatilinea apprima TaxID=1134406 RepID=A0A0P6X1D5_9CHLR|nr:50S ribosomal protein L29 [Ornatilinea apprima]KPL76159.1 50S ribosomal protein L29 [Ornatilinea apprima]
MKVKDMRLLSTAELQAKLDDARHELMNLRFQSVTGQLTDTSRLKKTRRLIAQFETILSEQKSAGQREGEK